MQFIFICNHLIFTVFNVDFDYLSMDLNLSKLHRLNTYLGTLQDPNQLIFKRLEFFVWGIFPTFSPPLFKNYRFTFPKVSNSIYLALNLSEGIFFCNKFWKFSSWVAKIICFPILTTILLNKSIVERILILSID